MNESSSRLTSEPVTVKKLLDSVLVSRLPESVLSILVNGICLDSRKLLKGEMFLALPGSLSDGRHFIDDAVKRGAAIVLAEASRVNEITAISSQGGNRDTVVDIAWIDQCPVISIENLEKQISAIAGRFFADPSAELTVIGVTGTNGKTTCCHIGSQMFALLGKRSTSIGTLGYGFSDQPELVDTGMTTPDAISTQRILRDFSKQNADIVTMEVSSHSLNQSRVDGIKYDVGVFTNLTRDHLDYHGNMEHYARSKQRLFEFPGLKNAVINIDDSFGKQLFEKLTACQKWSYAVSNTQADIYAQQVVFTERGIRATVISPWGQGEINSRLLGEFNLSNMLAMIAAACSQGAAFNDVVNCVEEIDAVPGRMEWVEGDADIAVVIDYAHTPDALQQALSALKKHVSGKLWCVFGCGGDRDTGKRPLMARAAEQIADKIMVTSDNPRNEAADKIIQDILNGFNSSTDVYTNIDRAEAIEQVIAEAGHQDCVLIAGKGHEDYQIINGERFNFCDKTHAASALQHRHNNRGL